jgi:hypothetical protein
VIRYALVLLLLALPGVVCAQQEGADDHEQVRGVTVSCQTWGWEWGSDDMLVALDEIKALGGNWVTIHPYARIRGDGSVRFRPLEGEVTWLTRPIAEAKKRGIKIMIKPHLAYWGSPFSWRGEITFKTEEEWARFWTGYEAWILRVAEVCKDADAFAVGTELDKTLVHEARWRALIGKVRERCKAPLTYAANWTDYKRVGFWDALDVIGIQGYFPLVNHQRAPTDAELAAGWKRLLTRLDTYAATVERKILFTELGYDRSLLAAAKPWERGSRAQRGDPAAEDLQRRCLDVALRAVGESSTVVGCFLWKWFPGRSRGEDFLASTPVMRRVIRENWKR